MKSKNHVPENQQVFEGTPVVPIEETPSTPNTNNVIQEELPIEEPQDINQPAVELNNVEESPDSQENIETPQAKSWRELREKAKRGEKAEKERDEALRTLQYIEQEALRYQQQQLQQQQAKQPVQPEEDDFDIADDDLVEGKHLKRLVERRVDRKFKKLEETIQKQQKYTRETAVESQLRRKYDDLDQVLTHDNIAALRELEPEISASLATVTDLKTQAISTYKIIKKMGIYKPDHYAADRNTAQRNVNKPRSLHSVGPQQGNSPLSQANAFANGLTPELKRKLYKEMQEKAKSR